MPDDGTAEVEALGLKGTSPYKRDPTPDKGKIQPEGENLPNILIDASFVSYHNMLAADMVTHEPQWLMGQH
ncbi:hypothetical protein N8T08_005710 [Aspergillus melleus]|uniref:Uncharacterized protein n=1 Tax=Aspergillus melleus TaxID=138277 RepID=A0ACC3B289_9EURO|nr:hypothetical protein N8T08_005710 [Aspergillus melleus]